MAAQVAEVAWALTTAQVTVAQIIMQALVSVDESLNLMDLFLTAAPWLQQIMSIGPSERVKLGMAEIE